MCAKATNNLYFTLLTSTYKFLRIAKSVCKLNKCDSINPPLVNRGRIIVHPSEKCDLFNDFFTGISHIDDEPELPVEIEEPVNILPDFLITEQEVRDQLKT